jgi:ribosomal protein S18 acetylase RimI-like enzyme
MGESGLSKIKIEMLSKESVHSNYDWLNIFMESILIGKLRGKFDRKIVTIYTVQIFPEYQGRGYGRQVIELLEKDYKTIVADRVRFSAKGFWEKTGFVERDDGCYVFQKRV